MMTLATRIDQFMRGYDFYNYQDYSDNDKQDHIDSINADLEADKTDDLTFFFCGVIEDILADCEESGEIAYFRDDLVEACEILEKLEEINDQIFKKNKIHA